MTQAVKLAKSLSEEELTLAQVFSNIQRQHPNYKVLLIADQFEELYTQYSDLKFRRRFLDCLLDGFQSSNSRGSSSTVLVTTMRADFLGNALSYSPLADVLKSEIQMIGAMNREHLSEVIIKPAAMLGVGFESGLVDRILNDVMDEPGNLALLEFTLTELWHKRTSNQLTHQAYDAIGQVKGALAKYAEKEYEKLEDKEKEQARQIFLQLVNLGEDNNNTRRRVNRQQIGENNWDLVICKGGLADSRLVVTSRDHNERETLEVVHEALIRHWKRLGQWLNEDRENLNKQRSIEEDAKQWDNYGQKIDYLLKNKRLRAAKEFQHEQQGKYPLSKLATEFIVRSIKHQRNELVKSLGLFLIIPLIGTATVAYFFVREMPFNVDKKVIRDCEGEKDCSGRIGALESLVKAGKPIQSFDLSGANLMNADLWNADLTGADLMNASLISANLMNASLISADLRDASLISADLRDAALWYADFRGADLRDANLSGANLSGADLMDADLRDAALSGADLMDADLRGANLMDADLRDAALSGADLIGVKNITYSQIKSACNWERAIYKGNWVENTREWVADEKANQQYIGQIKQNQASDPEEPVDCRKWEKSN